MPGPARRGAHLQEGSPRCVEGGAAVRTGFSFDAAFHLPPLARSLTSGLPAQGRLVGADLCEDRMPCPVLCVSVFVCLQENSILNCMLGLLTTNFYKRHSKAVARFARISYKP